MPAQIWKARRTADLRRLHPAMRLPVPARPLRAAAAFGLLFDAIVDHRPAFGHALAVTRVHGAEPVVMELDDGDAAFLAQPVLHVVSGRGRNHY